MNALPTGDVLLDTSILLRRTDAASAHHAETLAALARLAAWKHRLVITRQNSIEFRGVASRPVAGNGLGMTPEQADAELNVIESLFPRLPERAQGRIYDVWRDLCHQAGVSGKQVYDTRLAAVCAVAGVQTILTWNPSDFRRFIPFVPGLTILAPAEVLTTP